MTTTAPSPPSSSSAFHPSQLPSVVRDGLSIEKEAEQRRKTCRFLEQAAKQLKLPRVALATSMVIFHRFYAQHAFSQHDRFEVAMACIVLATKVEECPQKVKTVIELCHQVKVGGFRKAGVVVSGGTAESSVMKATLGETEYAKMKERVLLLERILLHTIGFELSIDHPYKFLAEQIRILVQQGKLEFVSKTVDFLPGKPTVESLTPAQTRDALMKCMMQGSMNFANDSLQTILCLQFTPKDIAATCVYLAGQFHHVKTDDMIIDPTTLVSIALPILEQLTTAKKKPEQQAAIQRVRKQLESLQEQQQLVPLSKKMRVS